MSLNILICINIRCDERPRRPCGADNGKTAILNPFGQAAIEMALKLKEAEAVR
jgi:electron transfer flavoprotein alpha/beta subunit